ncbi:MAG: NAD(P)/FAD-dependent oxidoreductase [Terriglobia bacterium]
MTRANGWRSWGEPPWQFGFEPEARPLPEEVACAVIGGGFSGLAAAAWLRRLAPEKTVVVLEASCLGAGGSGRTGGIALGETAAGDLAGLGDVLKGFTGVLQALEVDCELRLSGVWEIARRDTRPSSPIAWQDSGTLRVADEVAGGTLDPGKLLRGLARAAHRLGASLYPYTPVRNIRFEEPLQLELPQGQFRARQVLFVTNGQALELSGLAGRASPKFTTAVATAPLTEAELEALGLAERKPFYTLDLPYLWGRVRANNGVVFGSGLVHLNDSREFASLDIACGQPAELLARLEQRVRGLHPALRAVKFTHRWGGPILFGQAGRPFFARHPRSPHAVVLAGYAGQGVTLSVYLACWAAEVLLGQRALPAWGALAS